MTNHLDWTYYLIAHTIAELLNLLAFTLIFIGAGKTVLAPSAQPSQPSQASRV